jgi:hypothetical protein
MTKARDRYDQIRFDWINKQVYFLEKENGKYEIVGMGHCKNDQPALYGTYDTIEECYAFAETQTMDCFKKEKIKIKEWENHQQ